MRTLIIIILLFLYCNSFSQKVTWQKLSIDSIDVINHMNNSIVDSIKYPKLDPEKSKIYIRVASTEKYPYQTESYVQDIVNEYIISNKIKDNGLKQNSYAIVLENNNYYLGYFSTETRYYFNEGCDIEKHIAIDTTPGINQDSILCIFRNDIKLQNSRINFSVISSPDSRYIEPYFKISYQDTLDNLALVYNSSFCSGHFEFKGLATIAPTFFNINLSVIDSKTEVEQILLQLPHNHDLKLSKIYLGDINRDGKNDFILESEDMLCLYRIFYMSSIQNKTVLYEYIGTMEVYCDCP